MEETKICTKCGRNLPLNEYRWKNKAKNLKHSQCKECQREAERIRYQVDTARREQLIINATSQREKNNAL